MKDLRLFFLSLLLSCLLFMHLARGEAQQLVTPDSELTPKNSFAGPALEFDFPALHIGIAEYEEGPTGTTVFYFPNNAMATVDVRGGAPGTRFTDYMRLGYEPPLISAICFAGGSAYGLEAADGVAVELLARRGYSGAWQDIAAVPGAIIFDLGNRRFNTVYPDKRLGRAALQVARPGRFYLGARGAGRFAMQGRYLGDAQHSGQGGAFRQVGPTKIAVFTVVNAVGTIVDRTGQVVRCSTEKDTSGCGSITDHIANKLKNTRATQQVLPQGQAGQRTQNTTITLVVTNQKLGYADLQRLAVQVHTSMARAIQPFHTSYDGDTLFAVTTSEVDNTDLHPLDLSVLAAEVAWDAVLNSVPVLDPKVEKKFVQLDPERYAALTGRYEFGPDARLTITSDNNQIFAEATGRHEIYGFQPGVKAEIFPISALDFFRKDPQSPHLRFVKGQEGRVTGLVLNPGNWSVPARKRWER